jgi:hypothetical protein
MSTIMDSSDDGSGGIQIGKRGTVFVAIGIFFFMAPVLGIQQNVLTFTPAVIILCICHWVSLGIYLRRL